MLIWYSDNYTVYSFEVMIRNGNCVDEYRLWWVCYMRENFKGMVI